jgi:8-oxo-dGTP pyrophosphatase MutT (NUDIX family)
MPTEIPSSTKPSKSSRRRNRRRRGAARAPRPAIQGKPAVISMTAGGIIFRRRGRANEIFFIKDPFGRWTFPKGKQQTGETMVATAVREIKEETGLEGLRLIAPLGKTSFRFRREVGLIHKIVNYFLFEAPADAKEKLATPQDLPEGKEPIFEAQWVPMHRAFSVSGYRNSDHLLARAFRLIGQESRSKKDPQETPRRP